jgi:hypothetical protein
VQHEWEGGGIDLAEWKVQKAAIAAGSLVDGLGWAK